VVLLLVGCHRDAKPVDVVGRLARDCPAAEIFELSSPREEWRLTFSPDGATAYWTVSDEFFPRSRQATIVWSRRDGDGWSTPEVAPFSGTYPDIDPHIAPDGQTLYFSSIRPVDGVARTDLDLWKVERRGDGWSEPVHLGAINSPADELYPSVTADGVLYFGSDRPGGLGAWDVYRVATGGGVENLGVAVNSATLDFNPEITPDGRLLLFVSFDRPGGYGLGDLYASELEDGVARPAANLGPCVNTAVDEYHPTLERDRSALYFVRHAYEPFRAGDFHRVDLR
jgi:hypothetical protein